MTEAEWLACRDPEQLLRWCLGLPTVAAWRFWSRQARVAGPPRTSRRKLGFYACACCHRLTYLLVDERSRASLQTAELHLDGAVPDAERLAAAAAARAAVEDVAVLPLETEESVSVRSSVSEVRALVWAARAVYEAVNGEVEAAVAAVVQAGLSHPDRLWVHALGGAVRAALLRDIVGNPFQRIALPPSWQTPSAVEIARTAYTDHAFDRLPILADALEDAGCTDRAVLDNCRQPGEHARGCWVVDLVLDKA